MIRKVSELLLVAAMTSALACGGGDEKKQQQPAPTATPVVETPAPEASGAAQQQEQPSPQATTAQSSPVTLPGDDIPERDLGDGLKIAILEMGQGVTLAEGDKARFATKITTDEGVEMFSGDFEFVVGSRMAFEGFDRGVRGMALGEARRIKVPAHLGIKLNAEDPTKEPPPQPLVVFVQLREISKANAAPATP